MPLTLVIQWQQLAAAKAAKIVATAQRRPETTTARMASRAADDIQLQLECFGEKYAETTFTSKSSSPVLAVLGRGTKQPTN